MEKPPYWGDRYADTWELGSVADCYDLRPAYPDALIDQLVTLIGADAPRVLDAGCGQGNLARPLARRGVEVDAVDRSAAMVGRGRLLTGGDAPHLRWTVSRVESADVRPPYGLVVCGDSIHWFDWGTALPAFRRWLVAEGALAIVQREWLTDPAVRAALAPVYARASVNRRFRSLDPAEELAARGFFEPLGAWGTRAPWRPTLDELVGVHHSTSGFPVDRMTDSHRFDQEVTEVLTANLTPGPDDRYDLAVEATLVWGRPLGG